MSTARVSRPRDPAASPGPSSPPPGPSARDSRAVAEAAREQSWTKPSFAKELFLGRLRLDLLDPWPRPTPDDKAKGEAYLARLAAYVDTIDDEQIELDARVPDDILTGLAKLGAFGMKIPESYGGQGLTNYYYCKALSLVGARSGALGTLLSAHQSVGVPQPVKVFGTDAQKLRFLPRAAAGEVSAFLLTEPDVGSDPARLATTAVPTEGGYLISGTKLWGTNATVASLLVVIARVPAGDGHRGGITAFVVEAASPGYEVLNRNEFMGLRGIENALVRFDNVFVPSEDRLGDEGRGLKIALATLNTGRLSLPAMCVAATTWAVGVATRWGRERVQWGRPIGEHEAVAVKLSFMAATNYALEAAVELCCLLADDDANDIRIEAALLKLYASEMAWRVVDELVQIRGGRGYETSASLKARGEEGIPAERVLRDLRIMRIFEGSTEIMHLLIAREAVDAHLAVAGDLVDPDASREAKLKALGKAGAFYAGWMPRLVAGRGALPTSFGEYGRLAPHLRWVERASRRLARSIFYGMTRWQAGLERREAFLGRVVDIGAELFMMVAACLRAHDERDAHPDGLDLADVFCEQAKLRVDALFTALWRNTDAADRDLARHLAPVEPG